MSNLNEILKQFAVEVDTAPYGNGHINETYVLDTEPRTILQKINTSIFKNPAHVMENIAAVTSYLREKIVAAGGDPMREVLTVVPTVDGKLYYTDSEGGAWRMYYFIEGAKSYDQAETPELFAASAHGFGKFQRMLADFPAESLHETIEKFHDTGNRLRQFREALAKNASGRADSVKAEIDFVLSRADYVTRVTDAIADGSVPLRVTHNDTKLNNVMLDPETNEPVCVIDLDTVMPGSMLYDFGDALRFGASTGAEDETDLSKIEFDLTYFEAFTKAFLEEVGESVTPRERELMPFSVILMTLENGMRFLADHINGDVYYRIHRENHNLDRARTQFKLVADMEKKMDAMKAIVAKY
ncbi:MAG: aminoglycoside phosphotransferase family protein [Clostridia bacterium]|nr:aminoglycoside phosphotransferase family protein [Clostridia bacterium]